MYVAPASHAATAREDERGGSQRGEAGKGGKEPLEGGE